MLNGGMATRFVGFHCWTRGAFPHVALPKSREQGENVAVFNRIWAALSSRLDRAEGQGLAEYALILALIAIVAIIALLFLGGAISQVLSTVGSSV
jgi:pilus assembly protein Flp/PilA